MCAEDEDNWSCEDETGGGDISSRIGVFNFCAMFDCGVLAANIFLISRDVLRIVLKNK